MMNNFTPRAQQVLALARKEADRMDYGHVTTEHLLLGIIRLGQGTAFNVLLKRVPDLTKIEGDIEEQMCDEDGPNIGGNIPYTDGVKKVLIAAGKQAKLLMHSYVGTEHILLGLLVQEQCVAAQVLKHAGFELENTRVDIQNELGSPSAESGSDLSVTRYRRSTIYTDFTNAASNAIQYWERCRIIYNSVLGLMVLIYFLVELPISWKSVSFDGVLGFFLLAVVANILFSLAYLPDIFAQLSVFKDEWRRRRWILFVIGLAVACIITRWVSMSAFGLKPT
jgi:hypothetical protein